jgi:tetratricopeptide (TPR) repeat protein
MRLPLPVSSRSLTLLLIVGIAVTGLIASPPASAEDAAQALQHHLDAARKARTASDWETANAQFTLALRQAELLEPGDSRIVRALEEAARAFRYQKDGAQAIALQERAVELQRAASKTPGNALAESLYRLGKLYNEFDNKEQAEVAFGEALEIREAIEPATSRVSMMRRDLSKTIQALRPDDDEAEALLLRDLDQGDTASRREQLGRYYAGTDDHDASVLSFREAIAIERGQPLPSARRLVNMLTSLASQLKELGRYDESEIAFLEAIELREDDMGPQHPYLAFSLRKLAGLHMEQDRWLDAEAALLRARDLNQAAWGQKHHECSCTTGDMLTEVRNALGLGQEAASSREHLNREVTEIGQAPKAVQISDVDKQIRAADEQARRLRKVGDIEAAKHAARKGLALREDAYGLNSLEAAAGLGRLGKLFKDQRRPDEAVALYERRLAILEQELDAENPKIARAMVTLGQLERDRKNREAAEHYILMSVNLRELIGQRIEAARNLETVGNLNLTRQMPARAEANFSRAIELWEDFAGDRAPEIMRNRARMAQAYLKLGRLGDAEAMLTQALETEQNKLYPDSGLLIQLLQPLKTVMERTDRADEALAVEARLQELRNLRKPVPRNAAAPSGKTSEITRKVRATREAH